MRKFALDIRDPHATIPSLVQAAGTTPMGRFVLCLSPALSAGIVALYPKGRNAVPVQWTTGERSTAWTAIRPAVPTSRDAIANEVRVLKARAKGVEPDVALRGRWRGSVECIDGVGHLVLTRKVATYSTITIEAHAADVIAWWVTREDKWFSTPQKKGGHASTLAAAIQAAVAALANVVGEACTIRDTQLRARHDADYAARRPLPVGRVPARDRVDAAVAPRKGDRVTLPSGHGGTVTDVDERRVHVDRDDGVSGWTGRENAVQVPHEPPVRVPAKVVATSTGELRLAPTTPGSGGSTWPVEPVAGLRKGQSVTMEIRPGDSTAYVVDGPPRIHKPGHEGPAATRDGASGPSVGGYRHGDRAEYLGDDGQVTAVRPATQKVRWRSDVDGTERWVSPERIRPLAAVAKPADPWADKDAKLMNVFRDAVRGALGG